MKKLEQELACMKVKDSGDAVTALALKVAQIAVEYNRVHMFGFPANELCSSFEVYSHAKDLFKSKYPDLPYDSFDSAVKRLVPSGYHPLIK